METRWLKRIGSERECGAGMALALALALLALSAHGAARELDPAACSARFDVQRDKIIRTEESREMGARYLAELDVGARQECLRLCCETDSCDVFVYEEKSPGSCYLFACGPPEDFRCKFTAHGNFSSGVLAVARRRAEQQDRARLAQHEQALANLRSATSSTASTTTSTTTPPPPPPPTPAPAPQLPPPRRCSRYQFECHSGGECIAVYNACDGVPQCADGSDEAPELGCPAPAPPPPPPPRSTPPPAAPRLPPSTQESNELRGVEGANVVGVGVGVGAGGERWPHRLAQAQPHRYNPSDAGSGPHIFSHKGGLLQEPAEGAPPYLESPAWGRAPWPQPQPSNDGLGMGRLRAAGLAGARPAPRLARAAAPPRPGYSGVRPVEDDAGAAAGVRRRWGRRRGRGHAAGRGQEGAAAAAAAGARAARAPRRTRRAARTGGSAGGGSGSLDAGRGVARRGERRGRRHRGAARGDGGRARAALPARRARRAQRPPARRRAAARARRADDGGDGAAGGLPRARSSAPAAARQVAVRARRGLPRQRHVPVGAARARCGTLFQK